MPTSRGRASTRLNLGTRLRGNRASQQPTGVHRSYQIGKGLVTLGTISVNLGAARSSLHQSSAPGHLLTDNWSSCGDRGPSTPSLCRNEAGASITLRIFGYFIWDQEHWTDRRINQSYRMFLLIALICGRLVHRTMGQVPGPNQGTGLGVYRICTDVITSGAAANLSCIYTAVVSGNLDARARCAERARAYAMRFVCICMRDAAATCARDIDAMHAAANNNARAHARCATW